MGSAFIEDPQAPKSLGTTPPRVEKSAPGPHFRNRTLYEKHQREIILANSLLLECLIQLGFDPWVIMEKCLEPDSCRKHAPSAQKAEKT